MAVQVKEVKKVKEVQEEPKISIPLSCTLTLEESDSILAILSDLPIKYAPVFSAVQELLSKKFREVQENG